ncbi:MAG: VOC family protein [Methanomicrobiales archaeon]|nr:VOC family protein [Methanomicrobiales archaeon]
MPNIGYFEIPADNVSRARKFYASLFGWTIGPTAMPGSMPPEVEYQDVKCGEPMENTLAMGGMYKRQMPMTPFTAYVVVEDFRKVKAKVERLGGKILNEMEVEGVGPTAVIQDTEGNTIGFWQPVMKK